MLFLKDKAKILKYLRKLPKTRPSRVLSCPNGQQNLTPRVERLESGLVGEVLVFDQMRKVLYLPSRTRMRTRLVI